MLSLTSPFHRKGVGSGAFGSKAKTQATILSTHLRPASRRSLCMIMYGGVCSMVDKHYFFKHVWMGAVLTWQDYGGHEQLLNRVDDDEKDDHHRH